MWRKAAALMRIHWFKEERKRAILFLSSQDYDCFRSFQCRRALATNATIETLNRAGIDNTHAKVADKNAIKLTIRLLDMTRPNFLLIATPYKESVIWFQVAFHITKLPWPHLNGSKLTLKKISVWCIKQL